MKKNIFIAVALITNWGCSKNTSLEDKSFEISQHLQKGNIDFVIQSFYSEEYFQSLENGNEKLKILQDSISDIEIGKKENIIIDSTEVYLDHPLLPVDAVKIFNCYVPLGVKMPSVVPEYFLFTRFIYISGEYKLITLDLSPTKMPGEYNTIEIENRISIEKDKITQISLMYEGGYKEPLVFKKYELSPRVNNIYASKLDTLISILNESKIIKSQKENDTRRFNGDPQMGIINLNLNDEFNWTIFKLISEEENIQENFLGALELRYYKFLNTAVTYWIESSEKERLNRLMMELCHSGENKRITPKESIKLGGK